ncbi:MAG: hypothetical protein LQ341_007657, partial [Variospora aurantia]
MRLPYTFTSPDETQLQRRRYLLDTYGQVAQISALIPLLAYQLHRSLRILKRKLNTIRSVSRAKEHASPVTSNFGRQLAESQTSSWDRLTWFLDQEVLLGWGTWRVLLVAAFWTMWLFVLAVSGTEDEFRGGITPSQDANGQIEGIERSLLTHSLDYLHLTKRFGIIAASQLPLHYLLALKSSYSPISLLTRLSHEELNPYHRALGRILLIFLSLHASFYLNFYVQKSLLLKRIRDADVILGLLAITSLLILGTTALARIRRKNYLLFFTVHVALSISLLPILYFHVSHLRPYILESALIYALLILQRNVSQTSTPSATLARVPGTKNL